MRIEALHKTSLLDFPGKVSVIVFTQGCNFLCPYCHNAHLVLYQEEPLALADILAFLERRKRLLEGIVITGGEPTLQEGLAAFCLLIKSLGYAVKLDTNGSRPQVLRRLLQMDLLDYVAMDVKADPSDYPRSIAPSGTGDAILQSMELLEHSSIPHEFRIPCAAPFITPDSLTAILDNIGQDSPVFLQRLHLHNVLDPGFFPDKGQALADNEIEALLRQSGRPQVTVRE